MSYDYKPYACDLRYQHLLLTTMIRNQEIALSAPDLLNSRLLLDHMVRTGQLFSPVATSVGRMAAIEDAQEFADSYALGDEWHRTDSADTSAEAIVDEDGTITIEIGEASSDNKLHLEAGRILTSIHSFAELSFADRRAFFPDTIEQPVTRMPIDIFWSRQQPYLLEHRDISTHIDGAGQPPRGNWMLGHIASIGAPTVHVDGQVNSTYRDNHRGFDITGKQRKVLPSGHVTRLHRTSAHAKPIRYEGARLFFRTFHNIGYFGETFTR